MAGKRSSGRRTAALPEALIRASRALCRDAGDLRFGPPVAFVYNPLDYARAAHEQYLARFASAPRRIVFLGMNPGPWGMAQTGVPFGDVRTVRDWLGIDAAVGRPRLAHPSRPVLGLDCPRVEVSGRRLWGFVRERFECPEAFFREHFVANYCPLMFLDADGRNLTPDKLPARDRAALLEACDRHLASLALALRPEWIVGVGAFAARRIARLVDAGLAAGAEAAAIPHPSPASPRANAGWAPLALEALVSRGIWPAGLPDAGA